MTDTTTGARRRARQPQDAPAVPDSRSTPEPLDTPEAPDIPVGPDPAPAGSAMAEQIKPIVEALIFASPEPLTLKEATGLLDGEATRGEIAEAIALLRHDYERAGGLQLVEVAGGYQIVTRPELHEYVRRLFHERTSHKLSVQALETLAVIAYRQPVTAPEIAEIRGVNTSGVLNTLINRKLVKIVGRKAVVGRPFMYGTTREFLEKFGLNDITDLPKVEDLAEVLGFEPPIGDVAPAERALSFDFEGAGEGRRPPHDGSGSDAASRADAGGAGGSEDAGDDGDELG